MNFDAIAIGAAKAVQPIFFAPRSIRTPCDLGLCGGIG